MLIERKPLFVVVAIKLYIYTANAKNYDTVLYDA